jgi:hypothetical protein
MESHFQNNLLNHFSLMKSFQEGEIKNAREDNSKIRDQIATVKTETREFLEELTRNHERTVLRLKTQNSQQHSLLEKVKKDNQDLKELLSTVKGDFLKEFKAMQQYIDFSAMNSISNNKSLNMTSMDDPMKLMKVDRGKVNMMEDQILQQKKAMGTNFSSDHSELSRDGRLKNFS